MAVIDEFHRAFTDDSILEPPGSFHAEMRAVAKGRSAAFEAGFESGQRFVVTILQDDLRRDTVAFGDKFQPLVLGQPVSIGAQGEKVRCCFDRSKACAGHEHCSGIGKAFDGGPHGGLELQDLR